MLAGLVQGYTAERDRVTHEELAQRSSQRDMMVQYLGHLASNPNVPPEHQQWALGKVQELIQADPTKKLPKIDLGELPPVSVPQPARQASSQAPAMALKSPVGPSAPGAVPAPASVGRAPDNTVNATGAVQQPIPPAGYSGPMPISPVRMGDTGPANVPNSIVGGTDSAGRPTLVPNAPNFSVAPSSPVTLPAGPRTTISNPTPPVPISQGGLHLLTPSDKSAYASAATGEELNRLRQQFPDKSDEDLLHFAKTGEFPKDEYSLSPGEKRFKDGKEVASNTAAKPGEKTGYSYEHGPSGEVLIKDNHTGATLSQQQIDSTPEAKAVYDTAKNALHEAETRQDERDQTKITAAAEAAEKAFERGAHRQVMSQAVDAAKKAKPMVDVLDASEKYMAEGKFSPREDLALIVRAVRAMNPGTVRLPQKELELELHAGSYGDRFRRWFDTATAGVLPDDQRNDLMSVIRKETTQTATSAANDWRDSFQGTEQAEPPRYLRRFETKEGGASGTGPGQFTVTDPEGGVHTFPDKASADRFKKDFNIP
jgi:hypothetical protein